MNSDIIAGKWEQLKGEALKRWGLLTDDQLTAIQGDRTKLVGQIREAYGIAQDEAEKQVSQWEEERRRFSKVA